MDGKAKAIVRVVFAAGVAWYVDLLTGIMPSMRWIFWVVVALGILLVLAAIDSWMPDKEATTNDDL